MKHRFPLLLIIVATLGTTLFGCTTRVDVQTPDEAQHGIVASLARDNGEGTWMIPASSFQRRIVLFRIEHSDLRIISTRDIKANCGCGQDSVLVITEPKSVAPATPTDNASTPPLDNPLDTSTSSSQPG